MAKETDCVFLHQIEHFFINKYGTKKGADITKSAFRRYAEICAENKDEPKALHMHTRERIYPGIASFDALILSGASREEASDFIMEFYSSRSAKMGEKINKIMRFPGLYKLTPKIFRKMTSKMFSEQAGFKSVSYDTPKDEVRFDMINCPYFTMGTQYGCPEIVNAYCHADDICFGNMHKRVKFHRTKTLGSGDDCCDFNIKVISKMEAKR